MLILKLITLIILVNLYFKNVYCQVYVDNDFDMIDPEDIPNEENKFKNELMKKAKLIFDNKKYKFMRDSALIDKKKLKTEKRAVLLNLDNLHKKKKKIEKIISKIQDGVQDDDFEQIMEQCRNKLKTLNDRKSAMFGDAPSSQYNLDVLNADITEFENNLANLNHGKHEKLSFAYSQLVDVYKEELTEVKRKSELESVNKISFKNIQSIFTEVKNKVKNLINGAADFIVLSKSFDWIEFDKEIPNVPRNAVIGGEDKDSTPLYIIRGYEDGSFMYGKYAFNNKRRNAYLMKGAVEFELNTSFELLTAKNFLWCNSTIKKGDYKILPICRAYHNNLTIPGLLLKNDTCQIGFGLKTYMYSNKYDVLSLKPCKVVETTTSYQDVEEF